MELETSRFGCINVSEKEIWVFAKGLPGFEQHRSFVIIRQEEAPFSFMQSTEEPDLAFIVANPFDFFPDYEFSLPESIVQQLNFKTEQEVDILNIVTIRRNSNQITLNLLAPIVMNLTSRQAQQIILHDSTYRTNHIIAVHPPEGKAGE